MQGETADKVRLQHIYDAILEIESYLSENDFNSFIENSMLRFACVKQLEIIGEVSNHITTDLRLRFSEVPWQQIVGMRNIFVHEYFGVDSKLVWEIILNDLPGFKAMIEKMMNSIGSGSNK